MSPLKFLAFVSLNISISAHAQDSVDTLFIDLSLKKSSLQYSRAMGDQWRLYNGGDYKEYRSINGEHPYFLSSDWSIGSILYDGDRYDDVPLLYDLFTGKVITSNMLNNRKMQLVDEKIKYFILDGHRFVHLRSTGKDNLPKEGYFEVIHDGQNTKAYSKHIKAYNETISGGSLYREFEYNVKYYILKKGAYYPVKNNSSILRILADQKQNMKKFISTNHIRFKTDPHKALAKILSHYDTLIP